MCGIHLIIDQHRKLDDQPIRRMLRALHHRGPDHSSVYSTVINDTYISLANNRLKITDPSDLANQPFHSACGRYVLVYNGELYNTYRLKEELLLKGYTFRTKSDTEVLLNQLIENSEKALPKLDGMFAFIFLDKKQNKLLIARDRHGIKPLFYNQKDGCIIVSSEIKGILASRLVEKEIDTLQIAHYLQFRYVKKPATIYKTISELEEGHFIHIQNNKLELKNYTKEVKHLPSLVTSPDIVVTTRSLIKNALRKQTNYPGSKALFLSGGVDSTLLLAIAREEGIDLQPYAIVQHRESSFGTSDTSYARLAAKHYGVSLTEVAVDVSALDHLEACVQTLDQPIGDSGALLTSLLSQQVALNHKVAFSGAGADEWFGGYNRHQAFYQYLKYHKFIRIGLPVFRVLSQQLPVGSDHPFRKSFRLLKKLGKDLTSDPAQTFYNFQVFNALGFAEKWSSDLSTDFVENYMKAALHTDRHRYLISDILALSDQMSMQNSLELRVPYLDNELIAFLEKQTASKLLSEGPKWILKKLLVQYGGETFANRPKEGFGAPFGNWIRNKQFDRLSKYLTDPNLKIFEFADYTFTKQLLEEHLRQKADHSLELWNLLTLSIWLEK